MGGARGSIAWWTPWVAAGVVSVFLTSTAALLWEPRPQELVLEPGVELVVDPAALDHIDLDRIHTEIVPIWVVSRGGVKSMHWERLAREVAPDRNLRALVDRMGVLIEADPVLNAKELMGLIGLWNRYLEAARRPWRLAGEVRVGGEGGTLRLKTYRVIDEGQVRVGERDFRTQVRRRADDTTQVDTWLGLMHSHEDGVVVLLDRVTHFTLDAIWPMLDPALDAQLDPLSQRFAPAVRAEAAAVLAPEALTALQATAEDRFWMNRAADSVHRRHRCGSQFMVSRVPWNGMDGRDLATLQLHAAGSADNPCPDVTEEEALVFSTRSFHLRRTEGVREALEALVAWVASAVVVHEARHAADVAELEGQPIPCLGCPDETSHVGALEGSAYLATFATPGVGALSLYQACALDPEWVPDRAAMIRFLAESLQDGGCEGAPAEDLAARAARLEVEVFGRSQPIEVTTFPTGLPVSSEYTAP